MPDERPRLGRGGNAIAFGEEFGDLALRHGLGEQIALPLVAAFGLGARELLLGLDALDDGGDAEAARQPTTARMMAWQSLRTSMSRTKERSILILSNGKFRKYASDE